MIRATSLAAAFALASAPAFAGDVTVTVTGTVTQDTYNFGPMNAATAGSTVAVTFDVFTPGTVVSPGIATDYDVDLPTFAVTIDGSPASGSFSGPQTLFIANDATLDDFEVNGPLTNGDFFGCDFETMPSFFSTDDISMLGGTYAGAGAITTSNFRFTGAGGFLGISVDTVEISGGSITDYCVVLTTEISSNSYGSGPLAAPDGTPLVMTFNVSAPGSEQPGTGGAWLNYAIDLASFDLDVNGSTGLTFNNPANFGIVNAFPVSDGLQGPNGQLSGGQNLGFSMGAVATLFATNDITQLLGTYDLGANLTSFGGMIFGGGGFMDIIPVTLEIKLAQTQGEVFCFGDGGDQMGCTDCPCGNNASAGTRGGCLNSAGRSAEILQSGIASVAADTLRFEMRNGSSSTFANLFSGDATAPANPMNPCFALASGIQSPSFDGLRCVVQGVLRHGTRMTDASGDVGVTTPGWGLPDGPMGGLIANGGFAAGQVRHYQIVYRDDPMAGCNTGLNTTPGVTITYVP